MGLLKQNVLLDNGLTAQEVYYNITGYQGDKNNVIYFVNAYASRTAYENGMPLLFRKNYIFETPSDQGIINYGYTNLKLTDDFKDATDVLES